MAINSIFLVLSFISSLTITISPSQAHEKSVTIDLIHRDSPLSPFYNPSTTKWDLLGKSFNRSISRINRFKQSSRSTSPNDIASQVSASSGEYVMELSIGTPPVKQLAIVDTGSDLIWTQCQPCTHCYKQVPPFFNPKKSSTYEVESCQSNACVNYLSSRSCSTRRTCVYQYSYGDRSHTVGNLATETFTFESDQLKTASFDKILFGCGFDNGGTFGEGASGLVGLGGGPLSLVSQLSSSLGGKFSYCLVPLFQEEKATSSKIFFGEKGEVSGRGVISTPIFKGDPDTFYFLTLESISVGEKTLPYKRSTIQQAETREGNIIIDSGTTLTMLPPDMMSDLESALKGYINGTRVNDPQQTLNLCYQTSNGGEDLNVPTIIAHFTGADLELKPINAFVQTGEGVVCLAMIPSDSLAILGNLAQANYLVGYDIEEGKVSFKATDCSKE